MERRHVLSLAGTLGAAALAGCTTGVDPPSSAESPSPTPAVTPPEETPAEGACTASVPTPTAREGFPDPKEYPDPPADRSVAAVSEFAEQFEAAYAHNSLLVRLADADCARTIDASVTSSTFDAAETGFVGRVTVRKSYTAGGCEKPGTATGTTTPIYADFTPARVGYYVTDRFVLRDGDPVVCR